LPRSCGDGSVLFQKEAAPVSLVDLIEPSEAFQGWVGIHAITLSGRQPCGMWGTLNARVDFRDVSHEPQPSSRGPSSSTDEQRRNRVDYSLPLEPFALADF
jgi:hypothetical protein